MKTEGINFEYCRNLFLKGAYSNIYILIEKRYEFIKQNISKEQKGIEFGAGAGLSNFFLKDYSLTITDFCESNWLDLKNIDAQKTDFPAESFDYILMINVLHHLDKPLQFFREAERILKPEGKIVFIEPYTSLLMKLLLKLSKHESFYENISPLSEKYSFVKISKSNIDGNNSVAKLIMKNKSSFEQIFPNLNIENIQYRETFIFMNSGGQYHKSPYIPLPKFMLKTCNLKDRILTRIFPDIFALGVYFTVKKK
ncbi:MAG TPA: class I SAM-dependent methyltransferase [Bacteroidales bacterium]|jgi:SAM-dependent methyltransferase|nr:class I SAM-dependent methyltransferase [Bacteroidales bacterium]HOL96964.1 class I SAM-dependent methyltransferase [Bacteroidales bacterium]HOM36477.1 class I SAM-dependent methyltransferase [Bacteroidales bacterium]HPD23988.1 class I SAM-dependent methyltransferase [Bacteroidales bacterium]HRS98521.1 class I SAM-dependent methyltransferase [Bacteroidales bacterium]